MISSKSNKRAQEVYFLFFMRLFQGKASLQNQASQEISKPKQYPIFNMNIKQKQYFHKVVIEDFSSAQSPITQHQHLHSQNDKAT